MSLRSGAWYSKESWRIVQVVARQNSGSKSCNISDHRTVAGLAIQLVTGKCQSVCKTSGHRTTMQYTFYVPLLCLPFIEYSTRRWLNIVLLIYLSTISFTALISLFRNNQTILETAFKCILFVKNTYVHIILPTTCIMQKEMSWQVAMNAGI